MPKALITLARSVAESNPGDVAEFTSVNGDGAFVKAFDYLLPLLNLSAVWPELEPKTIKTVEKAYSQLVGLLD